MLKPDLSFAGGELDPILHDRVTLEKFKKGLATARNVMIGKTGSILSRFPRAFFVKAKNDDEAIRLYSPPNSGILTEWGDGYVRVYSFDGTLIADVTSGAPAAAYIENISFLTSGKHIYSFSRKNDGTAFTVLKFLYDDTTPVFVTEPWEINARPSSLSITATGTPAGYAVDYAVTSVRYGEESFAPLFNTSGTYKLPVASTQYNTLQFQVDANFGNLSQYDEVRIYRRPHDSGVYGLIGVSDYFYNASGALNAQFIDYGGLADFTNSYNDIVHPFVTSGTYKRIDASNGTIYQQRMLVSPPRGSNIYNDSEAIIASRPGFPSNFYRDYPLNSDSALKFKAGSEGRAEVLRMIENDGLIVFTTVGVFVSVGVLGPTNLALEKKGSWVIDESIPPLSVPGGVFFVDKNTNTVRQLIFSENIATYEALDQSIFSEHLFQKKTISSWCFQGGKVPLIIATFSDGSFATFTYNFEHQMRAWTRHDSVYPIEQVEGTGLADTSFFVINKNGNRYIEVSLPRIVPAATFEDNSEADKLNLNAFMDSIKTQQNLLNDDLTGSDVFELTPVVADTWDGDLTLTCGTSAIFTTGSYGAVGTIMRFFDTVDKSEVDLVVTARASDNSVTVEPSAEFPSAQSSGFRLYETFNTVTGLTHLEGENVSVMVDGYVVNSPNNDVEGYTPLTVSSGEITLPDEQRGAIILVGRPITADIKTLNISTVEQKPTLVESLNVNKLYIRVHQSRGLYVSNKFPEEDAGEVDGNSVEGMEDLDVFYVPSGRDIVGNRYKEPDSRRIEQTLPGNWESNGEISIRQVDPVHFEILSIIPDVEVLFRRESRSR